jgi:hypothetical protein
MEGSAAGGSESAPELDPAGLEAAAKAICYEIDDSAFEALENGKAEYRRAAQRAIAAYLSVQEQPHEREALTELLAWVQQNTSNYSDEERDLVVRNAIDALAVRDTEQGVAEP